MAHTKAKGSTKLGRESESKRLGVKLFDGEKAKIGDVIIRQRGTKYYPGVNVKKGGDDTLYAVKKGVVKFSNKRKTNFDGSKKSVKVVSVNPL
ncbi:50S ribosomal protein L27 [Patescibacteria group bacterium]|nr:50S ribosomal protein L27 [Patescibacteria group bacterium]